MRAIAAAVIVLVFPLTAAAADGVRVLDCIRRLENASWSSRTMGELFAAVACMGISPPSVPGAPGLPSLQFGAARPLRGPEAERADFDRRVEVIRDCFEKVRFRVRAQGLDAENIAATACIGCVDAEETADCVEQVSWKYEDTKGTAAELLAAQACSRGNPAEETADCVGYVSFRLSASGVAGEILATTACSR